MKLRVVAAALAFVGMISSSFAYDGAGAKLLRSPIVKVVCDTRATDAQGQCVSACDDAYIRARQFNMADQTKVETDKKACDVKCGCADGVK